MIIPWDSISEEALLNVVQEYILREGTDYGITEVPFLHKQQNLISQIKSGKAIIVWSELHSTLDIKVKEDFIK